MKTKRVTAYLHPTLVDDLLKDDVDKITTTLTIHPEYLTDSAVKVVLELPVPENKVVLTPSQIKEAIRVFCDEKAIVMSQENKIILEEHLVNTGLVV